MASPTRVSLLDRIPMFRGVVRHVVRWSGLRASAARAALDLLFPTACVGCGAELAANERAERRTMLCVRCVNQLALFTGPTCRRCSAPTPVAFVAPARCVRCDGSKLWFDESLALGEYVDRLRQLVLAMKRDHGNPTSLAMGQLIWHHYRRRLEALRPDYVVPVPMHWRRRTVHGTNSAALLAEVLSQCSQVSLAARLVRRRRHTKPQFSLPPSQRLPNVRGAFAVRKGYPLTDKHVLLVDDIMTTGATCSELARVLKGAGASRVTVVVAARTLLH